jgi:hypothetical protein
MNRRCDNAAALVPFDLDCAHAGRRQCRQRLRRVEADGFLEQVKGALRAQ